MKSQRINHKASSWILAILPVVFLCLLAAVIVRNQGPLINNSIIFKGQSIADTSVDAREPARHQAVAGYGKLPLSFEANQGQSDEQVKFLSRGKGYTLFLTPTEAVLSLRKTVKKGEERTDARLKLGLHSSKSVGGASSTRDPQDVAAGFSPAQRETFLAAESPATYEQAVLHMKLLGANPAPQVSGLDLLPGKSNYLIGNDPSKWRTNVSHYAKVKYDEVYPGIGLVYYGTDQAQLEYDFVVAPGADPNAIRLGIDGAEEIRVDEGGDLVVETEGGEIRFHKPVVYQIASGQDEAPAVEAGSPAQRLRRMNFSPAQGPASGHGFNRAEQSPLPTHPLRASAPEANRVPERQYLDGRYVLAANNRVSFEIAAYDASKPLIIDPVLSYSTFLGGSGSDSGGFLGVAVDTSGNVYLTGSTRSSDFPTTAGAFDTDCGTDGNCDPDPTTGSMLADAFVTKISTDFSLSASPTTRTITAGQSAAYALTISPINGFAGDVLLSCSGAPLRATCTIAPTTVNLDGTNDATAQVSVTTTAGSMLLPHPGVGNWAGPGRCGSFPWPC